MNFKKICPRDCPERYPGCGAKCPTWQEYVAERDARYRENMEQREIDEVLKSFGRRSIP